MGTRTRHWRPTRRALLALIAAALASPGCFTIFQDIQNAKLRLFSLKADRLVARGNGSALPSSYVQITGKSNKEPRQAFWRAGIELFQPFDASGTAGFFEAKRLPAADGQRGCLEIDEPPNGGPLVFAVLCADYFAVNGGFTVGFFHNLNGAIVTGPSIDVPGTLVDLRVTHDGANLNFFARATGAPTWTAIGSVPYIRDLGMLPSFGASNLNKGGEFGFTNPMVESASHTEAADTGRGRPIEYAIYADLMHGEWHLVYACFLIEIGDDLGAEDQLFAALFHLDRAVQNLDSATSSMGSADDPFVARGGMTLDPKALAKAQKNVGKARGKVEKAQQKLGQGKAQPAGKQIHKAIESADKGALTLQPFENAI